ncbi:MAG: hypothetical protein WC322_06185 [Candidatus Paceibacterota bacterium]|jgi:hypothetical protein
MPQAPLEKEQGAVQEEEALAAGEAPPANLDVTAQAQEMAAEAVAPEATVDQAAQQAPPEQQGRTVKNPYMLLPQQANYGRMTGERPKTPTEAAYDAGVLFQVLGQTNPMFKGISEQLMKTRKR